MYRFLILTFFFVFLNASSILNITYFPLSEKVDILFSLDKPFNGKIILLSQNSYKITNISLDRIEQKKINNSLNITISPLDENSVNLKLDYKKKLTIKPSVTTKGYGLRIRILGLKSETFSSSTIKNLNSQSDDNLSQKMEKNSESNFNYISYILVILILIALIFILLYVKKKAVEKLPIPLKKDNYKILYQKMIDPKNKIVMIELFEKRYLLLLGEKNNLLLDKFSEDAQEELKDISTQNEFGKLLDEKLDDDINTMNFIKNATKLKENNEL